jgi:hypothetical protein
MVHRRRQRVNGLRTVERHKGRLTLNSGKKFVHWFLFLVSGGLLPLPENSSQTKPAP